MSEDSKTTDEILREGKALEIIHNFTFNLKVIGDEFLLMKVKRPAFVDAVDKLSRNTADALNALYNHPPTAPAEKAKIQVIVLNDTSADANVSISLNGQQIGEGYAKNRKANEADPTIPIKTSRRVVNVTLEVSTDRLKRLLENPSELPPEAK